MVLKTNLGFLKTKKKRTDGYFKDQTELKEQIIEIIDLSISEIANKLNDYDKDTYNLFIKYFKLFKDCEKAIEKIVGHETLVDAHRYNFGYSSDGKLKCLDI